MRQIKLLLYSHTSNDGEKNKVVYFCVHFHSCCSLNVPLVHSFAHFYPHELNKKKIKAELYECLLSVENDLGAGK